MKGGGKMRKKYLVLLVCSAVLASILLTPTLIAEGAIDERMENSLQTKLENAQGSADLENICAATNQLEALINQVNAQRGKKISIESADSIIFFINSVIDWYLAQLPEGESC